MSLSHFSIISKIAHTKGGKSFGNPGMPLAMQMELIEKKRGRLLSDLSFGPLFLHNASTAHCTAVSCLLIWSQSVALLWPPHRRQLPP